MVPLTINGLKRFLARNKWAFYNHPDLLSEIRQRYWGTENEEETLSNTDKNSRYRYCRILHKMERKKRKTQETKERKVSAEHASRKVRFIEEVRSIEDPPGPSDKKKAVCRSILKRPLPLSETSTELERKRNIYIPWRKTEKNGPVFKYSE